jgi:Kef-type K+ transport system membrane component KefB
VAKTDIIVQIVIAFAAARLLGRLVASLGFPSVIGELLAGAILGPYLLGWLDTIQPVTGPPQPMPTVWEMLMALGVILLLFTAGLGTHIRELSEVRATATAVGIVGAVLPLVVGFAAALPFDYSTVERLFVATALMATSVGITVRVLHEFGYEKRKSARIILAAAVIDDILGLFVLTLVIRLAEGQANPLELGLLVLETITFLGFFVFIGPRLVGRISTAISRISEGLFFEIAVIVMLAMAVLAEYIGLAAIVGAFLAGAVLAEVKQHHRLEERFAPLAWFFSPFFFVAVGSYIDFASFAKPPVLAAVIVFTLVAVVTKYFGSVAAAWHEGMRIANEVGVGMIPRGEVGIVVAGIALAEGAVDTDVYSAVLAMVVLTSFIAPFLIAFVYRRRGGRREAAAGRSAPSRPLTY